MNKKSLHLTLEYTDENRVANVYLDGKKLDPSQWGMIGYCMNFVNDAYSYLYCRSEEYLSICNYKYKEKKEKPIKATNIYVMIDDNTGFYKIGRSINPTKREKTLQSEKATIKLLFFFKGTYEIEKYLHKALKEKCVRGEWFNLSNSDLEYIKSFSK
jgi:hypothetical protein